MVELEHAAVALHVWDVVGQLGTSCHVGGQLVGSWLVGLLAAGIAVEQRHNARGLAMGAVAAPCVSASLWLGARTAAEARRSLELLAASAACGLSSLVENAGLPAKTSGVLGAAAGSLSWWLGCGADADVMATVLACCAVRACAAIATATATKGQPRRRGEAATVSTLIAVYVVVGARRAQRPEAVLVWHGATAVAFVAAGVAAKGGRALVGATCVAGLASWAGFRWRLGEDPIAWLARFVARPGRPVAVASWAVALAASLPLIARCRRRGLPRLAARKLFHFLAVGLFLPVARADAELLGVAYGVALALFVWLEVLRFAAQGWALSRALERFYAPFLDADEGTGVALSHIYLILGCATTHWLAALQGDDDPRLRLAGLAVLGIGDAAAAIVGSAVGTVHWPRSNRTLEGSLAFCVATALALRFFVDKSDAPSFYPRTATQLALLEAASSQIDNLFLPLFAFATLQVDTTEPARLLCSSPGPWGLSTWVRTTR